MLPLALIIASLYNGFFSCNTKQLLQALLQLETQPHPISWWTIYTPCFFSNFFLSWNQYLPRNFPLNSMGDLQGLPSWPNKWIYIQSKKKARESKLNDISRSIAEIDNHYSSTQSPTLFKEWLQLEIEYNLVSTDKATQKSSIQCLWLRR